MVECPEKLHTGADLMISLSIYLKPSAFKRQKVAFEEQQRSMFDEGQETAEEQMLRERKSSLLRLFKTLGLKPRRDDTVVGNSRDRMAIKETLQKRPRDPKPASTATKTEIVGDGEEVEVNEEGDDLSENELNFIYKKYEHLNNFPSLF